MKCTAAGLLKFLRCSHWRRWWIRLLQPKIVFSIGSSFEVTVVARTMMGGVKVGQVGLGLLFQWSQNWSLLRSRWNCSRFG